MKSLIITVAGMSSRFNKDTEEDVLKCLYYEGTPANSLLSIQVHKCFDLVEEIIVVGGYKYDDLEFVFVNDCTPDNSIDILKIIVEEKYPALLSRVKIINHEKNRGSAAARNTLLDNATGEFVCWVDADDWLDKDTVAKFVHRTRNRCGFQVLCTPESPTSNILDSGTNDNRRDVGGRVVAVVVKQAGREASDIIGNDNLRRADAHVAKHNPTKPHKCERLVRFATIIPESILVRC